MDPNKTLSVTSARKQIFKILDDIQNADTRYTITEKGSPKAVIMSAEEYASWAETLEVLRDFPEIEREIAEAKKDYAKGNTVTLLETLAKEGFVLADSAKKAKYSKTHPKTPTKTSKKRKKNQGKISK